LNDRAAKPRFTHLDEKGRAHMVEVGEKEITQREAEARGRVLMSPRTLEKIRREAVRKGDVLGVARIAGIMAAKRTAELIPLCHQLSLTSVVVEFELPAPGEESAWVEITAVVRTADRTGVEMEALIAVSTAALTIYDMCKALDRGMQISDVKLIRKSGGRSGVWERPDEAE